MNYHKLDRKLLERLTYEYPRKLVVGPSRSDLSNGTAGAERRLAAGGGTQKKKKNSEAILKGEPPLDVYVRWKALSEQPIGWDPDIDDGVRLNIRPFTTARILRHQPVVNGIGTGRTPMVPTERTTCTIHALRSKPHEASHE